MKAPLSSETAWAVAIVSPSIAWSLLIPRMAPVCASTVHTTPPLLVTRMWPAKSGCSASIASPWGMAEVRSQVASCENVQPSAVCLWATTQIVRSTVPMMMRSCSSV